MVEVGEDLELEVAREGEETGHWAIGERGGHAVV